jgi:hypothetical protein
MRKTLIIIGIATILTIDTWLIWELTKEIIKINSDKNISKFLFFYPFVVLLNSLLANLFFYFNENSLGKIILSIVIILIAIALPIFGFITSQ